MMDVASGRPGDGRRAATATAMRTDAIADGVLGEPAIKIFKPGSEVVYTCEIYDGRGKRKDGFSTRATLIRDGRRSSRRRRRRSAAHRRTPSRSAPYRSAASCRSAAACRAAPTRCRSASAPRRATARDRHGVAVGRLRGALMQTRHSVAAFRRRRHRDRRARARNATGRIVAQQAATPAFDDQPTFRVGTRLATIDAVVVDDKGRHVTDLKPDDFEIVERGKSAGRPPGGLRPGRRTRPGTAVALPAATAPAAPRHAEAARSRPEPARRSAAPAPSPRPRHRRRRPRPVRRERRLRAPDARDVRRDQHSRPGDLVAIIRTAGGVGTLQQFTTDRRLLQRRHRSRALVARRAGRASAAFEAITPAVRAPAWSSGVGQSINALRDGGCDHGRHARRPRVRPARHRDRCRGASRVRVRLGGLRPRHP